MPDHHGPHVPAGHRSVTADALRQLAAMAMLQIPATCTSLDVQNWLNYHADALEDFLHPSTAATPPATGITAAALAVELRTDVVDIQARADLLHDEALYNPETRLLSGDGAATIRCLIASEVIDEAREVPDPLMLSDELIDRLRTLFPFLGALHARLLASGRADAETYLASGRADPTDQFGLDAQMTPHFELASTAYWLAMRAVIRGYKLGPGDHWER